MKPKSIVIRKYENRRLYDTSRSKYINLEEIARLVRNGKDVRVIDAKTGDDLTRVILTQIIVEDAKEQPAGLPLELLRQLIMATDEVGREFVMWYLKSALDGYRKVQNALESGMSEMQSAATAPLDLMRALIEGKGGKNRERPAGPEKEAARRKRRSTKRRVTS